MKPLVTGLHHFQAADFPASHRLFEPGGADRRAVLLIVCSDLESDPFHLIPTKHAHLYPLQCLGNIVLPGNAYESTGEGAVEQTLAIYKPTDIVICGHTPCGILDRIDDPTCKELPRVASLFRHARKAQAILEQHYTDVEDSEDRRDILARENVLAQLENIRTLKSVSLRLDRRKLHLHGWLYREKSIYAYEVRLEQFVPLAQ